jgi:MarR family transcriptional regulator for hemolysin
MVFTPTHKGMQPHEISVVQSCATRNIVHMREKTLKGYGLTSPEWFVLGYINAQAAPDGVRVGEIAQALNVQSTYVTGTLRPLIAKGLVNVAVHPVDRRARCITVSKQGSVLIQAIDTELGEGINKLLGTISDTTWRHYLEVLKLLAAATVPASDS